MDESHHRLRCVALPCLPGRVVVDSASLTTVKVPSRSVPDHALGQAERKRSRGALSEWSRPGAVPISDFRKENDMSEIEPCLPPEPPEWEQWIKWSANKTFRLVGDAWMAVRSSTTSHEDAIAAFERAADHIAFCVAAKQWTWYFNDKSYQIAGHALEALTQAHRSLCKALDEMREGKPAGNMVHHLLNVHHRLLDCLARRQRCQTSGHGRG